MDNLPNLKMLYFFNGKKITNITLPKSLENLCLCDLIDQNEFDFLKNTHPLKSLYIQKSNIAELNLPIVKEILTIKDLPELSSIQNLQQERIETIYIVNCPKIMDICLPKESISATFINLSRLSSINIENNICKLDKLKIQSCNNLDYKPLNHLTSLKTLMLLNKFTDHKNLNFLKDLTQLESLYLGTIDVPTRLQCDFENITNITLLHLQNLELFNSSGNEIELGKIFPNIAHLTIHQCPRIKKIENLKNLELFKFYGTWSEIIYDDLPKLETLIVNELSQNVPQHVKIIFPENVRYLKYNGSKWVLITKKESGEKILTLL